MHKHLANSWNQIYREDSLQLWIVNALEKKKKTTTQNQNQQNTTTTLCVSWNQTLNWLVILHYGACMAVKFITAFGAVSL